MGCRLSQNAYFSRRVAAKSTCQLIEERIGQGSLWENVLVCDERCMKKIWWLVKALCHRCNGEDCKKTMVRARAGFKYA